jgi:hypothetical protein
MRPFVAHRHPFDHEMSQELMGSNRRLISTIPSFSAHCDTAWLADDRWTPQTWEARGTLYGAPPTTTEPRSEARLVSSADVPVG